MGAATASPASTAATSAAPYGDLPANAPRVWFNNRTQATERVNALASGGMDDIDIPAFLRRQAD
jgi:cell division protein FtsZ